MAKYFPHKLGSSWLKIFHKCLTLWRVIFLRSFLRARILSGHFLGEVKYRSKGKYFEGIQMQTPFKFIIVEEVMSSSLFAFKRLNLNSSEMGKVILFPLIRKFLKSFKFHTSFNHSSKQTNNLIIILRFQNL